MADSITTGGLEFYLENRNAGMDRDGGPSLQVRGTVDGNQVQLLRFDLFRIRPHYHYAPDGQNIQYAIDPLTVDDGIGWVVNLLSAKLPKLIAKAGYDGLATESDLQQAAQTLPEIERRWRAIA